MKYVITGGAGHISSPIAEKLLEAGQEVVVIGRSKENLKPLIDKGATAAIGSVDDVNFLTKTFAGADAIYTMVPPNMTAPHLKNYIAQVGKNYTDAIKASGSVKYVVNLSSIGAHATDGVGPVTGLHRVEESLNTLTDVNIKHLRPGYFFNNLLANAGMAKHMNIIGGNFGGGDFKLVMANTHDIADVAIEELLTHNFTGHSVRYVASDERTTDDIAKILGESIGKPGLAWVVFNDEQSLGGMMQAGLTEEMSRNYVEMGNALQSGLMNEDYWKNKPTLGKNKLEDFAKVFAAVYNAS